MNKQTSKEQVMLYQCIGLQRSANTLYQILCSVITATDDMTAQGIAGSHIFSITILRALCAERTLKLAKSLENKAQWKNTHDLWVLYEDLKEDTKEEIGKGKYKSRNELEDIIQKHRNSFNEWRYTSERGRKISTQFNDMKNTTQQILEWCEKEIKNTL